MNAIVGRTIAAMDDRDEAKGSECATGGVAPESHRFDLRQQEQQAAISWRIHVTSSSNSVLRYFAGNTMWSWVCHAR